MEMLAGLNIDWFQGTAESFARELLANLEDAPKRGFECLETCHADFGCSGGPLVADLANERPTLDTIDRRSPVAPNVPQPRLARTIRRPGWTFALGPHTVGRMSPTDQKTLRYLLDRAEISDVQLRYATGTDFRNWELFRSCFTDDIEVDFSEGFGMPVVHLKADEWVKGVGPRMESFKATQHMITNHVITFEDDDHATCVAYVRATHHLPNSTGDSDQTVFGYYTNRFERTSSGWRIATLKLTSLWMKGNFGIFQAALS